MTSKASAHAPRHASATRRAAPARSQEREPQLQEMFAVCMGLPWLDMWMRAWNTWFEMAGAAAPTAAAAAPTRAERRDPAMPWVPQFESRVIPFRRHDDAPGLEATRMSMRMRVPAFPWILGTSNVIAIDTLMPRPADEEADPETAEQAKAEAREAEQMRKGDATG